MGVAGSVGKTSSKLAIAHVLGLKHRVRYQEGNYNDLVSIPLIFFGEQMPVLLNPLGWLTIFWRNEKQLRKTYPYDVVVVEIGTDAPGQIAQCKSYLRLDIGVLTAITPEHMEYFKDLDDVAAEELKVVTLTSSLIYNKDLIAPKYINQLNVSKISYSLNQQADFRTKSIKFHEDKCDFEVLKAGSAFLKSSNDLISEPQLYAVTAAVAVASQLGLSASDIDQGLHRIHPVSGRMQRLNGLNGSMIIDDTYNASPEAMKAAIDTLSRLDKPNKIAVLGNMNELGSFSKEAHTQIGGYCGPNKIDLVITIGPDANKYLAPAAEGKGCKVATFDSPYIAGEYIKSLLTADTAVLVKGSQNKVFAEETVKRLLADQKDADKLVRQSTSWMKIKNKTFSS